MSNTYGRKQALEVSEDEDSSAEAESSVEVREPAGKKKKVGEVYVQRSKAVQAEMRRLAQKFKEVDDWALEIEDVTPHSGDSQMIDAR